MLKVGLYLKNLVLVGLIHVLKSMNAAGLTTKFQTRAKCVCRMFRRATTREELIRMTNR